MRLMITSGQGPKECAYFLKKAIPLLLKEARARNIDAVVEEEGEGSYIVSLSKPMPDWVGSWEWVSRSPFRPNHKRSRWYVEAKVMADKDVSFGIEEKDIAFQALTAGGPGGQHQNKTQSAIRAVWTSPDGKVFRVVARQERCQHRNRSKAISMLEEQVGDFYAQVGAISQAQTHKDKKGINRGGAVQTFKRL